MASIEETISDNLYGRQDGGDEYVYVSDIRLDAPTYHPTHIQKKTDGLKSKQWIYTNCNKTVSFGGYGIMLPLKHAQTFASPCGECYKAPVGNGEVP